MNEHLLISLLLAIYAIYNSKIIKYNIITEKSITIYSAKTSKDAIIIIYNNVISKHSVI